MTWVWPSSGIPYPNDDLVTAVSHINMITSLFLISKRYNLYDNFEEIPLLFFFLFFLYTIKKTLPLLKERFNPYRVRFRAWVPSGFAKELSRIMAKDQIVV